MGGGGLELAGGGADPVSLTVHSFISIELAALKLRHQKSGPAIMHSFIIDGVQHSLCHGLRSSRQCRARLGTIYDASSWATCWVQQRPLTS